MVPPRCTLSMLSSYQNDSANAQSLNYNPKMMVGLELSQPLPQHCMHPLMLRSPAGADLCERVWVLQPPPNLKRPIWAIRLFFWSSPHFKNPIVPSLSTTQTKPSSRKCLGLPLRLTICQPWYPYGVQSFSSVWANVEGKFALFLKFKTLDFLKVHFIYVIIQYFCIIHDHKICFKWRMFSIDSEF